jgi:hypothetical protein
MRLTLLPILLFLFLPQFAFADLERQIYYFTRQSELFKNVCFDANGQFRQNAVLFDPNGSLRQTAIDCDAQAVALNEQRLDIERKIQSGAPGCDIEIQDAGLIDFMSGIESVADEVQCPGNGGALQCVGDAACNLTSSLVPRFTRDVATLITGNETRSCGSDGGTNCLENLFAGAVFNVKDTGCGIASLFGYNCDQGQNSEAVSSDAAVMASFQNNQSVASFTQDPWNWMKQTASALMTQIGESIMERFGCAQWENPRAPFMSKCLRPLAWSCADCSAKMNMVCGVLGYMGGEVLVSFFTGAAVGIVARTTARIGVEAAVHFPRATASAARVAAFGGRWAARGGATVKNIWQSIAQSRVVTNLTDISRGAIERTGRVFGASGRYGISANAFAGRRIFIVSTGQDLVKSTLREFNRLAEEAYSLGYRSTGAVRSGTITNLEQKYTRLADIQSGAYAQQGIRTTDDFFRFSTRESSDPSSLRLAITQDGADSRVLVTSTIQADSGLGRSYQLTESVRAPASSVDFPPPPRRPEVIVRPPEAAVEPLPIVVTASRSAPLREYPQMAASTISESDVLRALGPDTPYNRELTNLSRAQYRIPEDFETAAFDLHEAWKTANPQLRSSRPELFVDYDDLPSAEKIRIADELGRGFSGANPAVLNSPGYSDFRASLSGTPIDSPAVGMTLVGPSPLRPQDSIALSITSPQRRTADSSELVGNLTTGRITTRTDRGEEAINRFTGPNTSYQDREITLDILLGGPRRDAYFTGRGARSPEFQRRYTELEGSIRRDPNFDSLKADIEVLARDRIAVGNRLTNEELDDIARNGIRTDGPPREIPCSAFANVTPGAFPNEGNCRRVKFDQDVNGRYCSCGAMGKTSFTWLVRCPTSTTDYRSLSTYVDELALPFDSAPDMCTRVDIPRGKECYIGPTSATFAGFGGATQILCEHRAPRTDAARADVTQFDLDFGGHQVRPVRWSPFTSHSELQDVVQRAANVCTTVCNVNDYRQIMEQYQSAVTSIRGRVSGAEATRFEAEVRNFELYLSELGSGRRPYPSYTDLSIAGNFNDRQRIQIADAILGRVDEVPARGQALIRSHEVAPDRGFGSYTQADLREKTSILRFGMGTEEHAAYRRANGNQNPTEVFSAQEADTLLRRGLAGNNPTDDFADARNAVLNARDLRGRLGGGRNATIEEVKNEFRAAAQGYEVEGRRVNSAQFIGEAWALYSRAGDRASAMRMVDVGLRDFRMNSQSIVEGMDRSLADLNRQIAASNPSNPALVLERDTLKAVRDEVVRRNTVSSSPSVPASVRPGPRPPARPEAQAQTQAQAPVPARAPALVVSEVPVNRAASLANDYRGGFNGREYNPQVSSELYYRASDGSIQQQRREFNARRETNYMGNPNFSKAFEQSLLGDGSISIQMVDNIFASGGSEGGAMVNAFLRENFERLNTAHPSAGARRNIRQLIDHVRERYGRELFDPQSRYLNSWRSANADSSVRLTGEIADKVQAHLALTPTQSSSLDGLIRQRGDRPMSEETMTRLLNNPSRPFRSDDITSYFPEGTGPEDVLNAYNNGYTMKQFTRNQKTGAIGFRGEINGNRYTLFICDAPTCIAEGSTVRRGEVMKVSPDCGPGIITLPRLSEAKEILRQEGPISRESFFRPMLCE